MQQRRIAKEWQTLIAKPVAPNVTVHENKDDASNTSWRVHYTGLPYTHYAGAVFRINVGFPAEYPFKVPVFTFLTPILHPNVGEKGEVCAELLLKGSEWSPAQTMGTLLGNLAQLIMEPAPEQPLNAEAAELFVRSRADFAEATAAHARKFAM